MSEKDLFLVVSSAVFVGGVLLAMFLVSARRMADVYDWNELPWWAYVGFIAPLLYAASQLMGLIDS